MVHDPERLFGRAQRLLPVDFLRERFGAHWHLFRNVVGLLPAAKAGAGYWQPTDWRTAKATDLRVVMAVRAGDPSDPLGLPPPVERDAVTGFPTDRGRLAMLGWRALQGEDVIDLLCFPDRDWAMQKPPLRLTGMARALGGAVDDLTWEDRAQDRVLVVRDFPRWVARVFDGPCLPLGTLDEQAQLLRSFHSGVLTEDVAHGKAVDALMRRPVPPPVSVYVEAGGAT